jgi:methenyltetrahydromethanopterin cyclohydrolase
MTGQGTDSGGLLNESAWRLAETIRRDIDDLNGAIRTLDNGAVIVDLGVDVPGGLEAGLLLARLCLADRGRVAIHSNQLPSDGWPSIEVSTDTPIAACLASQYAGWQLSVDDYFGMGSGPMRAAAGREALFEDIGSTESPSVCVGVIESGRLPDEAVVAEISAKTAVAPEHTLLAVAPTASQAGTVQVVARSVETAMHKLHELDFDISRIASGFGSAPLPPVAADDLAGIGRTNDAILYGAIVNLWVTGDDPSLEEIGPKVPSSASKAHGQPFLNIFADAGHDFYAIDPHLFSPAVIRFFNTDTGHVHSFGQIETDILCDSFGI